MRDRRDDIDELDDGRTIADMSDVRRTPLLLVYRDDVARARGKRGQAGAFPDNAPMQQASSRDISDELETPEERFMLILGALKAGLAIGLVYVIAFGIFIAILLAVWR